MASRGPPGGQGGEGKPPSRRRRPFRLGCPGGQLQHQWLQKLKLEDVGEALERPNTSAEAAKVVKRLPGGREDKIHPDNALQGWVGGTYIYKGGQESVLQL